MDSRNMSGHDVFISYSTKNKNVADAIVADFEQHGIKCWYAPRDILPGEEWVTAIKNALEGSKSLVLIYTDESNQSRQVMNEIAIAFNAGLTIVPFRLTEEQMSSELEYYLTRVHWLDAVSKPLNKNIAALREYINVIINTENGAVPVHRKSDEEIAAERAAKKKKKTLGIVIAAILVVVLAIAGLAVASNVKKAGRSKTYEQALARYNSQYHGKADDDAAREAFESVKDYFPESYYYLGMLDERVDDYDSAKKQYEEGIEKGSIRSLMAMGNLYLQGNAVSADPVKAKEYFDKAVDKGCKEANYYIASLWKSGLIEGEDADGDRAIATLNDVFKCDDPEILAKAHILMGDMSSNGYAGLNKDIDLALESYKKAIDDCSYYEGYANYYIGKMYEAEDDKANADEYFRKALNFCEKSADEGCAISDNMVGLCYQMGYGTAIDFGKSLEYFKKAADYGNLNATRNIGLLYETGDGELKQDVDKAYEYYIKAADGGLGKAMYNIGRLYEKGIYPTDAEAPDYKTARQWYEKAAQNGYPDGWSYAGDIYLNGYEDGIEDKDKAIEYYDRGIEMGSARSMASMGYMYYKGTDYDNALIYFKKGANAGSSYSMRLIGLCYHYGKGVDEDPEKAAEWYAQAASAGDAYACLLIGSLYEGAILDEEPDYTNAIRWYLMGADRGSDGCAYRLGNMYYKGNGASKDIDTAKRYYQKAADAGNAPAMKALGDVCYDAKDYDNAILWYEKTIKNGSDFASDKFLAMRALGDMYYDGVGVDKDEQKAKEYYLDCVEYTGGINTSIIRVKVDDEDVYFKLAMMCFNDEEFAESGFFFAKCLEFTEKPVNMYNAGVAYYRAKDYQNALKYYGMAIDADYKDSEKVKDKIQTMVDNGYVTEKEAEKWLD